MVAGTWQEYSWIVAGMFQEHCRNVVTEMLQGHCLNAGGTFKVLAWIHRIEATFIKHQKFKQETTSLRLIYGVLCITYEVSFFFIFSSFLYQNRVNKKVGPYRTWQGGSSADFWVWSRNICNKEKKTSRSWEHLKAREFVVMLADRDQVEDPTSIQG